MCFGDPLLSARFLVQDLHARGFARLQRVGEQCGIRSKHPFWLHTPAQLD